MTQNILTPEIAQQPAADLVRIDKEIQLIEARSNMQFALSHAGQAQKQFELNQRMGQMYARSTIVPDTYNVQGIYARLIEKERKSGNFQPDTKILWQQAQESALANCAIAVDMALRMKADPMMVMQNLYIVHGNPAWSSKFLVATINTCGRFEPLRYECNNEKGDAYGWRCFTYQTSDREHTERLEGSWITWKMVKAEGWDKKSGSKWLTMPEQMFRYRAAAFWQRQYAPEISMGFSTAEEQEDIIDVPYQEAADIPVQLPAPEPAPASVADIALQNARKSARKAAEPKPEKPAEPKPETQNPKPDNPTPEPPKEYPEDDPISKAFVID